jgi:hypothetical protein
LIESTGHADHLANPFEFTYQALLLPHDFIERIGNAACQAVVVEVEPYGEISISEGVECLDELMDIDALRTVINTFHSGTLGSIGSAAAGTRGNSKWQAASSESQHSNYCGRRAGRIPNLNPHKE